MIARSIAVLALASSVAAFVPMCTPALRRQSGMNMSIHLHANTVAVLTLVTTVRALAPVCTTALRKQAAVPIPVHTNTVAIAGTVLFAATPAFAGHAGAGEKIFNANCAACHAGGQNTVVPDHTLEKSAIAKFLAGGFEDKSVVTQVTNGKNAMPAFVLVLFMFARRVYLVHLR